jgi:very-short-patch-repair endonuclease
MSEAKCETGWGDLSTRAVSDAERPSPHPATHALRLCVATLPLQGRVSKGAAKMVSTLIRRAAAKKLRANTTPHERTLWRALRELPLDGSHFRRQAPIGPYVVDFLCPAKRLIIELDGGHHNEDEEAARDRVRQDWLEKEGYRVIRFWNSEISGNLNGVLEKIYAELYGSRDAEAASLKHQRRR